MARQRIHFPETLPGATKFSGDPELNDAASLVQAFKNAEWIYGPLAEAIKELVPRGGRPRMAGDWLLVALAFVLSRQGDIQPFHDRAPIELWEACGFDHRPSYSITHERLTELEALIPELEAAIGRMVNEFSRLEPRIGRHIHIDGTEAETHSRYAHDCRDDEHCAWRKEGETADEVNERVLGRAKTATAQRQRQRDDAGENVDYSDERVLDVAPIEEDAENTEPHNGRARKRPRYRLRTENHWWKTGDPDTGFRTYRKKDGGTEGWHGYYHTRAVDDFTGLTVYGLVASSSRTEESQYEEILDGIVRALNPPALLAGVGDDCDETLVDALRGRDLRLPEAICGDKGYGFHFIYEMNTRLGIHTITPWRKFGGEVGPTEVELTTADGFRFVLDRHGVPHCKHCGGPTKREEFRLATNENPRIYFRCLLPSAPESPCGKLQSVPCSLNWRMLTPVERTDPRHLAIEKRFQFERSHHHARVRNRNGGKDPIVRPKRLGRAWQQLLLTLGGLLDWYRAGLRHGWLKAAGGIFKGYASKVEDGIKKRRKRLEAQVAKRSEALRLERQEAGLDHCLLPAEPPEPEPPPPKTGT